MVSEFHDPADRPEASYHPEPLHDSLEDVLLDSVCRWSGPVPKTVDETKKIIAEIIRKGLRESEGYDHLRGSEIDAQETLIRVLQLFQNIPQAFVQACCYMRLTNRIGWSLDEIGLRASPPVSRQAVDKIYRQIQSEFEIKSRADKSDEARKKSREICLIRGKKKKARTEWTLQNKFKLSI